SLPSAALVALLVLAGAGSAPPITAQHATLTQPVSIPFEPAPRHVIVKVSVNRSRPLSFILDSGANIAIIRSDVARELTLKLEGTVNGRGAGEGTQVGSFVRNATWSLVGLTGFSQPLTLALPLTELPPAMGRDIDGIIGGEFIKQFVVELDYQART